jgi:hypothetical protein
MAHRPYLSQVAHVLPKNVSILGPPRPLFQRRFERGSGFYFDADPVTEATLHPAGLARKRESPLPGDASGESFSVSSESSISGDALQSSPAMRWLPESIPGPPSECRPAQGAKCVAEDIVAPAPVHGPNRQIPLVERETSTSPGILSPCPFPTGADFIPQTGTMPLDEVPETRMNPRSSTMPLEDRRHSLGMKEQSVPHAFPNSAAERYAAKTESELRCRAQYLMPGTMLDFAKEKRETAMDRGVEPTLGEEPSRRTPSPSALKQVMPVANYPSVRKESLRSSVGRHTSSVHIGTIDIHISSSEPPTPAVQTPPRRTASPKAGSLSRGFLTAIGLRQG